MKQELLQNIRQFKQILKVQMAAGDTVALFYAPRKSATGSEKNPMANAAATDAFSALRARVEKCRNCHLAETRRNVVFGEGDPKAELVFVGEAPGLEEDKIGRPFVGEAGKLLTKIIESIGLKREAVYICNVLKCRPPGNRNPAPEEIEACHENLKAQLALMNPKVICALGAFAGQTLLETKSSIGKLRGKTYEYEGIPVIPTYHPAALLYHPQNKKYVWQDMKRIAALLKRSPLSK